MTDWPARDDRAAAQFVDVLSIFALVGAASFLLAALGVSNLVQIVAEIVVYAGAFLVVPALFESRFGWTPGKRLCGLIVVAEDGRPPAPAAAFSRNVVKFGLSMVVLIQILAGRTGFHDAKAGTRVVTRETQRPS